MRLDDCKRFPCSRKTKAPLVAGGFKAATTDPKRIAEWRAQYPRALWGIPCGVAFDVLDLDGAAGLEWLREHESELPETRVQSTPRGRHYYFQPCLNLRPSVGKIAKGVDVRAGTNLSYVIDWCCEGLPVIDLPLAPWPERLLALATAKPERARSSAPSGNTITRGNAALVSDGRTTEIPKSLYYKLLRVCPLSASVTRHHQRRLRGILSIATRRNSQRNEGLFNATVAMRELIAAGVVSREVAVELLFDAAQCNGYVAKDGQRAALATIRSGLTPPSITREASSLGGPP